ncbi:DUF6167 family protein [Arthrobacter sp. ov118]|jgi:hypothetical protein|uniref:DUF6167 family protein n=1 Tax=Arthrobacter sp. ov118 TaxID=1761747 RepID=UPI0008ED72F4|nr:hypothetical protein SAMN04487915_102345 [Arthrobacter sp. ov118]
MNRIIWMGIGVAIGVIAFRKISTAQSALGPEGLNRAVGRLADGLFDFADAVREGMGEREAELRSALGIDTAIGGGVDAALVSGIAGRRDAVRR